MHKFAFGILGWLPYEYYTSSPYEFFAACEGYFDKMEMRAANLRLASYRIHQSLVTKPVAIEDYWPLRGDKKKETGEIVMTKDVLEQIKKAHNLT